MAGTPERDEHPDTEGGATRATPDTAPEDTARDDDGRRGRGDRPQQIDGLNPRWWAPVMVGLMVLGLLWVIAFYLAPGTGSFPIPGIGYGNLAVGFGMIMAGFLMTTRWK